MPIEVTADVHCIGWDHIEEALGEGGDFLIQDAGWDGGQHRWRDPLFTRFARTSCGVCGRRAFVPRHGGDLRGERGLRGEVVAAFPGER